MIGNMSAMFAWVLSVLVVLLAFGQFLQALLFLVRTRGKHPTDAGNDPPKAAILLSLRGADPGLAAGLKGFLRQDYPNYELRIVVDSETDPAWDLVHAVVRETGATNVRIRTLRERPGQCSLHCASLIQLARELDESIELFALADGDVVAHPAWLRELLTPIIRGQVDATTGHRWFAPVQGQFGSIVRYAWNAACVVALHFSGILWGGTFAGRTIDLRRSGLIDKWNRALAVDAPINECWRQLGLRVEFIPSLMMINREECSLRSAFAFVCRQLLWTRLYQPRLFWGMIVLHAFAASGMLLGTFGSMLYAVATGAFSVAAVTLGALVFYSAAMVLSLMLLEARVRGAADRADGPVWRLLPSVLSRVVAAVFAAQIVHLLATACVLATRKVRWRGVVYEIRSPFDVRKVEDRMLCRSDQPAEPNQSL